MDKAAGQIPSGTADALSAAHQKLLQDGSLQFDFSAAAPAQETPAWLKELLNFLGTLKPLFEVLFWVGVALLAGLVLFAVVREVLRYRGRVRPDAGANASAMPDWRPPVARARALLADADRLAAEGHYAEAIHTLLFRSIDDIAEKKPGALKPSFTSRDIALLAAMPQSARFAFARIAAVVERNFFGERDVDAGDYAECRTAYESFALPEGWSEIPRAMRPA